MSSSHVNMSAWELTKSQNATKARLEDLLESGTRRTIFLLVGRYGSGKTFLAKRFTEENDGAYCNLAEGYLQEILSRLTPDKISPEWMMRYLKQLVERHDQEVIVIDGWESITMMLSEKWVLRFLTNLKSLYIANKKVFIILGTSRGTGLISLEDIKEWWGQDRIVILEYDHEDAIVAAYNWGTSPSGDSLYAIADKVYGRKSLE